MNEAVQTKEEFFSHGGCKAVAGRGWWEGETRSSVFGACPLCAASHPFITSAVCTLTSHLSRPSKNKHGAEAFPNGNISYQDQRNARNSAMPHKIAFVKSSSGKRLREFLLFTAYCTFPTSGRGRFAFLAAAGKHTIIFSIQVIPMKQFLVTVGLWLTMSI